jgi:hypothetical protein
VIKPHRRSCATAPESDSVDDRQPVDRRRHGLAGADAGVRRGQLHRSGQWIHSSTEPLTERAVERTRATCPQRRHRDHRTRLQRADPRTTPIISMRRTEPISLGLRPAPAALAAQRAGCPACPALGSVIGRIGLRLVFRCVRCNVRFFRLNPLFHDATSGYNDLELPVDDRLFDFAQSQGVVLTALGSSTGRAVVTPNIANVRHSNTISSKRIHPRTGTEVRSVRAPIDVWVALAAIAAFLLSAT